MTARCRVAREPGGDPREGNLYDSLGELEARTGRTDAATAAYRKALELDPKLESSKTALEKLEKKETPRP